MMNLMGLPALLVREVYRRGWGVGTLQLPTRALEAELVNLGPLEIECDAPPYPIVQACNAIGVVKPEDVRWVSISAFAKSKKDASKKEKELCYCLEKLPVPAKFNFTYAHGAVHSYSVGQCQKCKTVYWSHG